MKVKNQRKMFITSKNRKVMAQGMLQKDTFFQVPSKNLESNCVTRNVTKQDLSRDNDRNEIDNLDI